MAGQDPVKRPRIAAWKIVAVLAILVLLTPVWIAFGCMGALLTLPSSAITKTGLRVLAVLGSWFYVQVAFASSEGDVDNLWVKLELGGWIVALLLVQWKFNQILVFHIRQKPEECRMDVAGSAILAILVAVSAILWKRNQEVLAQRQILSIYLYILLPVTVVVSHARLWIPARYSELEHLEHVIIGLNVKVPFFLLKVAGLGTVHVPCTATSTEEPKFPLVLLHGFAAGNALWACNFEELAKHYDVIDKFYLGGHSMGAMFATSYTVKYPGRVQHLALISPAGVGHPPAPKRLPMGLRIFRSVWKLRLTPMRDAQDELHSPWAHPAGGVGAYWYNNWALERSGEIAMHSHLLPGVYAKRPLCEMLTPENIQIPITFIYGGGPDWMSSSHGEKVAKTLDDVQVVLVPGAGHQLFMDNAPAFNEMLLAATSTDNATNAAPSPPPQKRENAKNLVLIHGFAGGNAVWAMKLSKHFNVYAVEWIGVGRSDRPDFNFKDYDSADDFVVGSFEKWQQEIKLESFDLCGHSMGAIFASSYALKHPEQVNHLVLASPAGVPHPPPPPDPTTEEGKATNRSWLRRMVFSAWENGVTPMSLARFVGPYGPKLVQNVVHRRTSFMSEGSAMRDGRVDLNELGEYIYHNWALKPSGERAMTTHLAPGAHAVRPLVDTLLPENVKMPLTFIYGEYDWMDYRNGLGIVDRFKEKGRAADLYRVPNGGHQMFMENPDEFSRILIDSLAR
ncbi:Alpha/Beta hydrolase fold [Phytophthora cactorum]|nr:Alpha/Beta hydrolase fold [Phytophthora cactorum]